jgi:hypothetical protein
MHTQELYTAGEHVMQAQKILMALECKVMGYVAQDAWQVYICKLEIKEHKLWLLEEQVGSSNATWVCHPLFPFCFPVLMKCVDWHSSGRA